MSSLELPHTGRSCFVDPNRSTNWRGPRHRNMQSAKRRALSTHVGGETLQPASVVSPQIAHPSEEVSYSRDDQEEHVLVHVVDARGSRVEIDNEQVATGLSMDVRVYYDRVSEESKQRMSGQEIGREDDRESGHVEEGSVDLELDHNSEMVSDIS